MGVKGYKGFKKGLICKDKQYKENTTFEEPGGNICGAGVMHFCENPFDVLDYYPLVDDNGEFSDFAEVEALGDVQKGENKSATNKLHIGLKLDFKGFVKACIDFTIAKTKFDNYEAKIGSSGYRAQIGSSGDGAKIGSSGYRAQIGSSGDGAKIGSSGDEAKIGSSGYRAKIGSSGDEAKIGSSGDWAQIGSSGDWAKIGSSGDRAKIGGSGDGAKIGSSGDEAKIGSSGKDAVIMAAGYNSIVKAKIGSWITLAEWVKADETDENGYIVWKPKCVKTEYVDGERIKEDCFYRLENGEFVEVEQEK